MAYNTPELLLVGSAQNLVLGDLGKFDEPELNHDPVGQAYSHLTVGDDTGW